ncbi:MAG: serine/threonine protein kinase [Myxococcales bacterium]|nr:serine/threonine protein kinase [Myxococcales bacterium]
MWICPECRSTYPERADHCVRDGAPLAEVQAHQTKSRYPLLGRVVGDRYHLIGGLGQGGLGTVYLAQHMHLGQLFAVKFLDIDALIDQDKRQKEETRRDFIKEARVASLIRHDSVVRVTDFGEYDNLPFLVMEYVPGPSLLHVLSQRGRFGEEEAISIARRIAEALDAFHERRLVHRDLKPANVILDPRGDGRLTLVDLGLVKDLSGPGGRASTHPLALRGTPGYLAPEQVPSWVLSGAGVLANGEKRLVDARVDIYALGVIFYEMLAGVSPYPDGTNTQIIVYCCTRDPIPLADVHPPVRLRPGLAELVLSTMNRDPEQRPASAADFLERLDAVALGVTASRTSWPALVLPRGADRLQDSLGGLLTPMPMGARVPSVATDVTQEADVLGSIDLEATHVFDEGPGDEVATMEAEGRDSFDLVLDHPLHGEALDDLEDASVTTQISEVPGLAQAVAMDDTTAPPAEPPHFDPGADLEPAVEAALRASVRGRPEPEPPPPPLQLPRKRPYPLLILLALGAGLASAAVVWLTQRPSTPPPVSVDAAPPPDATVIRAVPTVDAAPPVVVEAVGTEPADATPDAAPASAAPPLTRAPPRTTAPVKPTAPRTAAPAAPATAAPATANAAERELEQLLRRGRNAFKQRRYADALDHYQRFLERASRDHLEYEAVRNRVETLKQRLDR